MFGVQMFVFILFVVISYQSLCSTALSNEDETGDELLDEFFKWKEDFNKSYETPVNEVKAFRNFERENLLIKHQNMLYESGETSFSRKIWNHSDMSLNRKRTLLNGLVPLSEAPTTRFADDFQFNFNHGPQFWDWRLHGLDWTEVKDQESCGSCWAFTSLDSLSALFYKCTGSKITFSPQNLIDCNVNDDSGNWGCDGGSIEGAYEYIIGNRGIMSSADYPYESRDAKCKFNISKSILLSDLKLSSYASLPSDNENLWLDALYTVGPIAVGMNADLDSFFSYGSGIFYDEKCDETSLNHAVLLVGYGTDDTYGGYWIVKNTWGSSWGESGYFRIKRNHCGIGSYAVYPIFSDCPTQISLSKNL